MYNADTALALLKARMDRAGMDVPAPLGDYWKARIAAAGEELEKKGIHLLDTIDDNMLVADLAAERSLARDKPGGLPLWLKTQIRERWLQERGEADGA
jgi:hypothetical protein